MNKKTILTLLAATAVVSACKVGPVYRRPAVEVPQSYKEQNWKPAQPQEAAARGPWWSVFNDPVLDGLEQQVAVSNQTLKASEAAYRQALAAVESARSGLFPTVTLNPSAQRTGGGGSTPANTYRLPAEADWEPDVWGRIRDTADSAAATAQASEADLANATLSAQATLATDYFDLRAADKIKKLLDTTVDDDTRSLQIVQNQFTVGIGTKADVAQAQTQVDAVKSQDVNVGVQRAQLEHAIAVLAGKPPAEFTLAAGNSLAEPPAIPEGVPSLLLERRPDIASAERLTAAANAQIGVAEAAYYPDLTLTAADDLVSSTLGSLLHTASNVWSVGPELAFTLFDGGARDAGVKSAQAGYDKQAALYRQTVLTAFQQVEDNLAALRILAEQAKVQAKTVDEASQATQLFLNQYRAGTVSYTSVATAQAEELSERQTALNIETNRLVSTIQLVEALGGGWTAPK